MILTYVSIIFLDTYINVIKYLERFPLDVSINWHHLHQDAGKTYSEISKMRSYWKYQKQTSAEIWRRKAKLSVRQKRNILQQTKRLQEEIGKCFVKRVMVRAGIPPSISNETVPDQK